MYAERKNVDKAKSISRLYSADGTMNSTAMNADYRLRVRPDQQLDFVLALINEFKPNGKSLSEFGKKTGLDAKELKQLVKDLSENKGKSIVHAGNGLSEDVHIAVNVLNELLGNSALYNRAQSVVEHQPLSSKAEWEALVAKMNGGKVGVVLHVDTNPVYHCASDLGYTEALKKVDTVVTLAGMANETSAVSNFVLPINHEFESWGDHQTRTGVISLQQPVISPLYNSRQKETILLAWTLPAASFKETLYHEFVMNRWQTEVYPAAKSSVDFKTFWFSALHDGVINSERSGAAGCGSKSGCIESGSFIECNERFRSVPA
jgi:anaerobic selenocysteine-containing dehydrogenase